ncbi:MAG: hypothetical protein Q4G07_08290 [Oscillospiraceae bacterium]|nr:hypothetical protein [Oscillospiraceae bacterium]
MQQKNSLRFAEVIFISFLVFVRFSGQARRALFFFAAAAPLL